LGFGEDARESILGIIVTGVALVVMPVLGWFKLRAAAGLQSGALRADAYETIALFLALAGDADRPGCECRARMVVGRSTRRTGDCSLGG
jgi:hypothetical protein